jgi:uncharacterized protein YdaU (DUF1376 family)
MSEKQPFLPLFFGDFLASTGEWSGEEQALYLLLLGHQWSVGSLPKDAEKVRKLARFQKKSWLSTWETVSEKFPVDKDDRRRNTRLETHRERANEISKIRAAAAAKGVAARRNKAEANADDLNDQSASNSSDSGSKTGAIAESLPNHPNQTIPREEKEPPTTFTGRGKGSSPFKPLGEAAKNFSKDGPLTPPQEPQENGHDARSFDAIKENVATLAGRFNTQDPHTIHKLGGASYKLSVRQCEEAVKQLREDGFFSQMAIA